MCLSLSWSTIIFLLHNYYLFSSKRCLLNQNIFCLKSKQEMPHSHMPPHNSQVFPDPCITCNDQEKVWSHKATQSLKT